MNGARGEIEAMLAGAARRLCLTLGALAEIETALGVEGLGALAERMRKLSARDLAVVLAACCAAAGSGSWRTVWARRRSTLRLRPRPWRGRSPPRRNDALVRDDADSGEAGRRAGGLLAAVAA
ncbi:MAG: GTA-gp10 family protein [Brevundimonas sp.]|uniref:GTA-gp10 family protein n=1 Tax=Brevundimonas sp. TaxID=1871086 RepID=UPI0040338816